MNRSGHGACRQCEQSTEASGAGIADGGHSLRHCVEIALHNYFAQLDGQMVSGVYEMVLAEVEAPLLQAVLEYTRDNQTLAASVLGLNRGTLRKKLRRHGLL